MNQLVPPPMKPLFAGFSGQETGQALDRRIAYEAQCAAWEREHGRAWEAAELQRADRNAMLQAGLQDPDTETRARWQLVGQQPDRVTYIGMLLASGALKDPRQKRRGPKPGSGRRQKQDGDSIDEARGRIAKGEDRQSTLIDVASRMTGGTLDWRKERLDIALGYRKPRAERGRKK